MRADILAGDYVPERAHRDWHRALIVAMIVGLGLRLWIAWQPTEELVWRVNADDAYYYFKLAQNLGAGLGATFDGINPTNGYHPIYALLLVPIFKYAAHDLDLGVHLALTLVAVLSAATAYPIYCIGRRLGSEVVGVIGALLHLLNPWVIILAMIGVESAVYLFFFAWAVYAYVIWLESPNFPKSLGVGALIGLTIMARSEGGMLLIGILIDILVHWRHDFRKALLFSVLVGGAATLVCLPWAWWSFSRFGTPLQISSSAIMLHNHITRPTGWLAQIMWYFKRTSWFVPRYMYKIILFNMPALIGMGVLAVWIKYRRLGQLKSGWRAMLPLKFLAIPFVLVSAYYNLVLWHQQHWYFNALVLIPTILAMPILSTWLRLVNDKYKQFLPWFSTVSAVVMCVLIVGAMWVRGLYKNSGHLNSYTTGRWIAHSSYRTKTFAFKDSGILGFYCECKMINLDGVMNNSACEYYKLHGYDNEVFGAYLKTQPLDYLLLSKDAPDIVFWGPLRLRYEEHIPETNKALYRVEP